MNYEETINYLIAQLPMYQRTGKAAYKEGLENTWKLDAHFKSPHKKYPAIHVGGTNGKGSVCHMLASVLQHAGYKTGLHTSPHLIDFRERIRINGDLMIKQDVVDFMDKHMHFFRELQPSFFEMSVFMAFDYFAVKKVDVAVIEVGMGGRLDSTNIIHPVLSVITNIGMDHTEFLGDTPEKIAREKAGIIKDGIPVVIGEYTEQTKHVFTGIANEHHSGIIFAQERYTADYSTLAMNGNQTVHISSRNKQSRFSVETDLTGIYQRKNLVTVLAAIDELIAAGFRISLEDITEGLKNVRRSTGLRGRWDIIGHNPLIVCDTAHNAEGMAEVVNQLAQTPYKKLHMIIGFVADKDIQGILSLLPQDASYYFTRPSVPRGLDHQILALQAEISGLAGNSFASVSEALFEARANAGKNDVIFIGGSTFVVADLMLSEKI